MVEGGGYMDLERTITIFKALEEGCGVDISILSAGDYRRLVQKFGDGRLYLCKMGDNVAIRLKM